MEFTLTEGKVAGPLLICESYPGMREAFKLMLGRQYRLVFAEQPHEIAPLLQNQKATRLLIWDLDRPTGSLDETLKAICEDTPLELFYRSADEILATLKAVRRNSPALRILLVAGEFDYDFQIAAIQQCGLVSFLTKPWGSPPAVIEQIQVMLGDRKSSIRHHVLRIPISSPASLCSPRSTNLI